ncbi:MAG: tRNA pseudouridine(38-40) synthase TruA [Nitriliruptorales bacterium]|nr:tRNA pseudouridine(38-40) synthase TruA [Nitriliruptorales bacterium]
MRRSTHPSTTRAPTPRPTTRPRTSNGRVRLRIDLAYDGTDFRGFARQPDQRTVQAVLEDALARLCGAAVGTTGAGRTDAGVHASGQVVHCDVDPTARPVQDLDRMRAALDHLCGGDVTVWRVRRVPASFDARFSATQRRYRYRLCDAVAMDPAWRRRTWHVGPPTLDIGLMEQGGGHLVGEHVFASFCRKREGDALVRRLDRIAVRRGSGGLVVVGVVGAAFCHQMVRSIVGTLVEVGAGRQMPAWVGEVVAAEDRQVAGPVAPPHGLTLTGVSYRGTRSAAR